MDDTKSPIGEEPITFQLNHWLESLEERSSTFYWVFSEEDFLHRAESCGKRANSLESDPLSDCDSVDHLAALNSLNSSENFDEDFEKLDDLFAPCHSIAHRESDLLVALSENCTLGPVCYFCRYETNLSAYP